jgi:hypothetical protein
MFIDIFTYAFFSRCVGLCGHSDKRQKEAPPHESPPLDPPAGILPPQEMLPNPERKSKEKTNEERENLNALT